MKCSKMQPLQKTTLIRPIRPSNLGPRLAPPHHQEGSDACQLTWTPGDPLGLPGVRNEDLHTTLYTPSHLPRTYVYSLLYGGPLCQNWRARALPATEARRSCRPGAWQTAGRSHNEPCHAMPCATSTEGGARSSWTGSMSQQRDLSLNLSHCPRQTFTKRNVAKQRDSVPLRSSCTVAARIQVSESVPENFTCSCFRQAAISEEFALSSDAPRQLKSLQSWSQHVYRSTATSHCPLPEVLRCRSAQYMKGLAKPQTQ